MDKDKTLDALGASYAYESGRLQQYRQMVEFLTGAPYTPNPDIPSGE